MKTGFFKKSEMTQKSKDRILPLCGKCKFHKTCETPFMKPVGEGRKGILIVGPSPTPVEDFKGSFWSEWDSENKIESALSRSGIDPMQDCWYTGAVICKPHKGVVQKKHADYCKPHLKNTIDRLKPKVIISLGQIASNSVTSFSWQSPFRQLERWVGFNIPDRTVGSWICPTYDNRWFKDNGYSLKYSEKLLSQHINKAISLSRQPLPEEVDYKSQIEIIRDPNKAAKAIRHYTKKATVAAFDYETNCLNPRLPLARILSCAICFNGKKTISYPMVGEARRATREFLRSPVEKIATNMKFEEQWGRRLLKTRTRNWLWDTMLAAHWMDCRTGVTSIKFQAYVVLGFGTYNDKIGSLIKGPTNGYNNLAQDVSLHDLLEYNGLDSLLEYQVGLWQMQKTNYLQGA
jgi:uracil-DNA glycosylase family 4